MPETRKVAAILVADMRSPAFGPCAATSSTPPSPSTMAGSSSAPAMARWWNSVAWSRRRAPLWRCRADSLSARRARFVFRKNAYRQVRDKLVEGSVRRVGETITLNAQLISTETGAHVWADRFEGERSRLGELKHIRDRARWRRNHRHRQHQRRLDQRDHIGRGRDLRHRPGGADAQKQDAEVG